MDDEPTITSVRVFPTVDKTLQAFDNTKLVAINTCPTWGITRYTLHKTMSAGSRAMALEAGAAAHDVFAAHRLYYLVNGCQILDTTKDGEAFFRQSDPDEAEHIFRSTGDRLFGPERFGEALAAVDPREDGRLQHIQFSLTTLHNGAFYDDPGDKRRTVTNIEEMCIAYMDRFDWSREQPVVIMRPDESYFVGIEISVDVTIEFTLSNGETRSYRFTGKADGIHWRDDTFSALRVHENKTASRLGEAWEASWETNHQPTGYMIGMSTLLNMEVEHGLILGSSLPMPKSYAINGLSRVPIHREQWQFQEWLTWFFHTVSLHDRYVNDPASAPQYTHSCNRYFRPCSFIPLCASEPDERRAMIHEMEVDEWSPLEDEGSAD